MCRMNSWTPRTVRWRCWRERATASAKTRSRRKVQVISRSISSSPSTRRRTHLGDWSSRLHRGRSLHSALTSRRLVKTSSRRRRRCPDSRRRQAPEDGVLRCLRRPHDCTSTELTTRRAAGGMEELKGHVAGRQSVTAHGPHTVALHHPHQRPGQQTATATRWTISDVPLGVIIATECRRKSSRRHRTIQATCRRRHHRALDCTSHYDCSRRLPRCKRPPSTHHYIICWHSVTSPTH